MIANIYSLSLFSQTSNISYKYCI